MVPELRGLEGKHNRPLCRFVLKLAEKADREKGLEEYTAKLVELAQFISVGRTVRPEWQLVHLGHTISTQKTE